VDAGVIDDDEAVSKRPGAADHGIQRATESNRPVTTVCTVNSDLVELRACGEPVQIDIENAGCRLRVVAGDRDQTGRGPRVHLPTV
jgi:carotenoid cleavage dioxygenase-like enzyme